MIDVTNRPDSLPQSSQQGSGLSKLIFSKRRNSFLYSLRFGRFFLFASCWLVFAVIASDSVSGQIIVGQDPGQKIDQLRLNDFDLRTEISSVRVDRQVEIARLEGRLARLENDLRSKATERGSGRFAAILHLLNSFNQPTNETVSARPTMGSSKESAYLPIPAENSPSTRAQRGSAATDLQPGVPLNRSAPTQEQTKEGPERGLVSGEAEKNEALDRQLTLLIARDFESELQIDTINAKANLLERSQELLSLERLAAKGLASSIQLDLARLNKRVAELRLERLGQQLTGLRISFPDFFESAEVPVQE